MAQKKTERMRLAIRDAVIADVVENGLSKSPVSRIAKRAGVSAGAIYIYYPNKDEMLQSIFMEVKSLLHVAMMDAHKSGTNSAESIRLMWFALLNFILEEPDLFAFHEAVSAEKILNSEQNSELLQMATDIHELLQAAIDDGTLKNMPLDCLIPLLIAPAASLAKRMLANGKKDEAIGELAFDAIWAGISNRRD